MIKQLLNSIIAKYCYLSVSCRSIICLSLRLRQIIDLLATDKSRYFTQPRPIIANYSLFAIRVFQTPVEKRCFFGLTATFGLRKVSLKSIFKALGRKIIFYLFTKVYFEIILLISLHDLFPRGAMPWMLIRIAFR